MASEGERRGRERIYFSLLVVVIYGKEAKNCMHLYIPYCARLTNLVPNNIIR